MAIRRSIIFGDYSIALLYHTSLSISGAASTFSWLEPIKPYLIGVTIIVLVFAWYRQLKRKRIGGYAAVQKKYRPNCSKK